jgi:hypothetical protein
MDIRGIAVQALGFAGLACFIISFQLRENRKLFLTQLLGSTIFLIQFIMLGAYSGSIILGIGALRNVMLLGYDSHRWIRRKEWVLVYLAAFAAAVYLTWDGWTSMLTFAAVASCTIAYWTDNALYIRLANLLCASPCWLVYDFIYGSYAGMANEIISICSILISICRFGWKSLGSSGQSGRS